MSKKITIGSIIFLLIAAVSIIIVFKLQALNETLDQSINISATIIGTLASLATLALALLVFNKFGIDNILLEKQSKVVFSLLEKINNLTLCITSKEGSLPLRFDSNNKEYLERYYEMKLVFSTSCYINKLDELFKISDSPFAPKSIVEKMSVLRFQTITYTTSDENDNYGKVCVFEHRSKQDVFGQLNEKYWTVFELFDMYNDVKQALVDWIKDNTSIDTSQLNV